MIKYSIETLTDELFRELKPLLMAHWDEVAMHKDEIAFDPNWDAYLLMQEAGAVHTTTVRKDGELIGYNIFFLYFHPHYQNNKFAQNDVFYVDPAYRGGTIAYKMMKHSEKVLKELGCSVVMYHMKLEHMFDKLCEAQGYGEQERIYTKYIGE